MASNSSSKKNKVSRWLKAVGLACGIGTESNNARVSLLSSDSEEDEEDNDSCKFVGTKGGINANSDLPHAREDCVVYPMTTTEKESIKKYCKKCYCYICDIPAKDCTDWNNSHCRATRKEPKWQRARKLQQKKNGQDINSDDEDEERASSSIDGDILDVYTDFEDSFDDEDDDSDDSDYVDDEE